MPEPENVPEGGYKNSVVKTPDLLRDENAFLGVLGPCGNYGLYQAVIDEGEEYHCAVATALQEWVKDKDEDYCTWGFSEIPPEGLSENPLDYYLTASETKNMDAFAEIALEALQNNETSDVGHAKMFGYTEGAVRAHYECA